MSKKIIALILALCCLAALAAGCGANGQNSESEPEEKKVPDGLKVNYTVEDADKNDLFFMDRELALTAADTDTTQAELDRAGKWLTEYILEAENGKSAFDFKVDGVPFAESISDWTLKTDKKESDNGTEYTLVYTKSGQPLTVTVYATLYKNYAISEYVVWIENTGSAKTGQLTEFNALDQTFASGLTDNEVRITKFEGGHESNTSFRAQNSAMTLDKTVTVNGTGGKPSVTWAPYFNVQWHNDGAAWGKEGIFFSVGWPGQWIADITDTANGITVRAAQHRFDTYLNPGESVRSPLITMLFWEKDMMRSQNLWRRWLYNEAMYQPNGEPIPTLMHGNTAQDTNLVVTATTDNQIEAINKWVELGLDIDLWQFDAGWYDMANGSTSWTDTGDWTPSASRFGGTFAPVAETLHKNDINFIVWFEPERLVTDSVWYNQFKDTDYIIKDVGWHCFNLANDEATDYLIDFMTKTLKDNGIDIYRQDCNLNNAQSLNAYWMRYEEDDRVGFTENRYVINYLRYFDAINEATGTFIDNCASGGKRLDLESTKRAVACWRDDSCYDATLTQCQSWGINFFMPYSGQGSLDQGVTSMKYTFRSNMMPYTGLPWKLASINEKNIDMHKQLISEHKTYAHYLTQDYYPLTPFTEKESDWMAFQYHDAKDNSGLVQVFKRTESEEVEQTYYLSGLEEDTTYRITDIDTGDSAELTGASLMADGITVTIGAEFAAEFFHYEAVK